MILHQIQIIVKEVLYVWPYVYVGYSGQIRGLLECQRSQRTCAVKLRLQTDSCQREPILRFEQIRNLR